MERGRDLQVDQLLPDRIVVVETVQSESIDPVGVIAPAFEGAPGKARQQNGAQSEFTDRVVELLEGFFGREGGDDCDRRQPIPQALGLLLGIAVVRTAAFSADSLLALCRKLEADTWVDDREIDS